MKKFLKVFLIIIIAGVIGSLFVSGDDEKTKTTSEVKEKEVIEYQMVPLETLFSDLKSNALKAEEDYQDKYVEFTGVLSNIDSDGAYINIQSESDEFWLDSIQCYINGNEDILNFIKEHSTGDIVTIQGQISEIGEVLGYTLDIDTIQ